MSLEWLRLPGPEPPVCLRPPVSPRGAPTLPVPLWRPGLLSPHELQRPPAPHWTHAARLEGVASPLWSSQRQCTHQQLRSGGHRPGSPFTEAGAQGLSLCWGDPDMGAALAPGPHLRARCHVYAEHDRRGANLNDVAL